MSEFMASVTPNSVLSSRVCGMAQPMHTCILVQFAARLGFLHVHSACAWLYNPHPQMPSSPQFLTTTAMRSVSRASTQSFDTYSGRSAEDAKSVKSGIYLPELSPSPVLQHHSKFYIQEGMATFLVGDRLFKIHHHFLVRESDRFKSIILHHKGENIPLADVTCSEFESLLDFFYNGMHDDYDPTLEEWLALLSISTSYKMEKIRQYAISQIEPEEIDPIERVLLANRHDVDQWLAPAYAALCRRPEPLRKHEAEKLGLATTVKLAEAREKFRSTLYMPTRPPSPPRSPSPLREPAIISTISESGWVRTPLHTTPPLPVVPPVAPSPTLELDIVREIFSPGPPEATTPVRSNKKGKKRK